MAVAPAPPALGMSHRIWLKGSDGKIIARRQEVWSSRYDRCQRCKTTDRPHEARGFCHGCYNTWRYETNFNGYRDKYLAYRKRKSFDDDEIARRQAWDEHRKNDPRHRELIRQTKLRWAKRNGKYAAGKNVRWEIIPGHWGEGTIIENGRGFCQVRSEATGQVTRMPHKSLNLVLEACK